ncbi:MAG: endo-1,4-beta-xylanase [Bacteroidetes bacterium]|nr:endo-1,4-beta-xylanase [Bacteroidota bacterium]HET6244140.1 endo-1,4-beta-xylanase [Bacteroidia bacterium]
MKLKLLLLVSFIVLFSSCKKDIQKLIDCNEKSLYKLTTFNVGVAVSYDKIINNERYKEIVKSQFNSITPEYAMKAEFIHPEENVFNWDEADQLVDFSIKENKSFHGHALIWHNHLPHWMENYTADWNIMFRNHIIALVSRYKGKIKAWDVVNEAFEDDGSLRNTIWKQHIGEHYITLAFQYASQADPDALLFYNDYNLESKPRKMEAVLKMAKELKSLGIQIHGIGMQMHVSFEYPTDRQIQNAIKSFEQTNLKVHISELDVVVNSNTKVEDPTFHLMKEQKKKVKIIVEAFNKLPSENKYGISIWGVSDADTWVRKEFGRKEWPLLYDENYSIKPSYCGFVEGLE